MARKAPKKRLRDGDNRRERIARQEPAFPSRKPPAGNTATVVAVCGLLALAIALVFAQSASHGFVNFDDPEYVQDNPVIAGGVTTEGIAWSFHFHNSNWHPLTWLSHMLDCQLYGVARPAGHHLTGVLLHAINTLLLFLVLRSMTGDLWPAAFAAALFGVHPLHVESVAWVAERKDVLSGLFFMLSLAAYAGYSRRPFSIFRYLLVTVLFALGLMAKPMLVTLPFVFLMLDYWPLARIPVRNARVWSEKLPWLVISAASCVVTYYAQTATESVWERLPLPTRIANALISYAVYLRQFVYPVGLAAFYPHPQAIAPALKIAVALLLLAAVTGAFLACRRRLPCLLVGWLWYLGMLIPVIGLVQVGAQARADRYSYLPQIGLYIALAWGLGSIARKQTVPNRSASEDVAASPRWRFGLISIASAFVLAALTTVAWRQAAYWKDGVALWSRVIACTSPNSWPRNSLGRALAERGKIDEAVIQFRQALALDPGDELAHSNLGIALALSEDPAARDEAIDHFQSVLKIKPNDGLSHANLGYLLLRRGDLDEAIVHLQRAVALDPNDPHARGNLAAALAARAKPPNSQLPPPRANQH
jgi:tetratricopeptide (TPR) repeat protein